MKERPILFSGPMVRAILAGTKTVTRRLVRGNWGKLPLSHVGPPVAAAGGRHWGEPGGWIRPYATAGDRLWVRETWGRRELGSFGREKWDPVYRATDEGAVNRRYRTFKWIPSIHMPRDVSRLTLEVVSVRVERLQEISGEDVRAEGVLPEDGPPGFLTYGRHDPTTHLGAFALLWDSINGKRASWASNPWIWRIEFKRVEAQ